MVSHYIYSLMDADGVVQYVGKGTGRRVDAHLGIFDSLAAGAAPMRASKVHRRFAAEVRVGERRAVMDLETSSLILRRPRLTDIPVQF